MAGHSKQRRVNKSLALSLSKGESNVLSEPGESKDGETADVTNGSLIWWTYILECCDGSYYVGSTGE